MDYRLSLSLLLLLAYASGSYSAATKNLPVKRQLHRRQRQAQHALSEFLVPPPAPPSFRNHRTPGSNGPGLSPPPPPQHVRSGRYIGPQNFGNALNNGPGYFSKLANWLGPFNQNDNKDSHGQGAMSYPRIQYAPHQPYTSNNNLHYQQPVASSSSIPASSGFSSLAGWMSGKSCNPCNEAPWIPVLHQYAPNAGSNAYLPPPPLQPPPPAHQTHHTISPSISSHYSLPSSPSPSHHTISPSISSHYSLPSSPSPSHHTISPSISTHYSLSSSSSPSHLPPLNYNSKPFNEPSPDYSAGPPDSHGSLSLDYPPSQNFEEHHPTSFDSPNVHQSPPQLYDQPASPVYKPPQELDHPPSGFDEHPPSDFDLQQPSSFDYGSQSHFDSPASSNYDEPPAGPSSYEQHHQSSQIVDIIKEPPRQHQDADNAESRNPVYVNAIRNEVKPSQQSQVNQRGQHQQNGPTLQNVYFQRSPLLDLSVAGESTSASPIVTSQPLVTSTTTPSSRLLDGRLITISVPRSTVSSTPPATLIDYIVSGGGSSEESSEEKESRPTSKPRLLLRQHLSSERIVVQPSATTTTTTTTTTTITTGSPSDQREQESRLESLVQAYEIYRRRNETTRSSSTEATAIEMTRMPSKSFNDTDDYSGSREVVLPNKSESGKKNKQIIQIIIPYTSQHTPSPFHSTRSVDKPGRRESKPTTTTSTTTTTTAKPNGGSSEYETGESDEDNAVIEESRRVPVSRSPPRLANAIDVHRLQKNIDNWTIQEYSKSTKSITSSVNSTYPRWLSSKQIPDEYLLSTTENDESAEYYDFSNETKAHRQRPGHDKYEVTARPESVTKVEIINATYPRKPDPNRWRGGSGKSSGESDERVYVVTPIPNPNSLEDLSYEKGSRNSRKSKVKQSAEVSSSVEDDGSAPVERAYQVLPQAVNNLAVLSSAPDSAAPALWGIMEHEEIAASADQPRWRSEADSLPEPISTPILYAGHSKVSRAR